MARDTQTNLQSYINTNINTNGINDIFGSEMNKILLDMTDSYRHKDELQMDYTTLKGLYDAGDLPNGSAVRITDYKTYYTQPVTEVEKVGDTEQLIVYCQSTTKLAPLAYSPSYPNDIIVYDITYTLTTGGTPARGKITYRKNVPQNLIYEDGDFRAIQFKLYKCNLEMFGCHQPQYIAFDTKGLILGVVEGEIGHQIATSTLYDVIYNHPNIVDSGDAQEFYVFGNKDADNMENIRIRKTDWRNQLPSKSDIPTAAGRNYDQGEYAVVVIKQPQTSTYKRSDIDISGAYVVLGSDTEDTIVRNISGKLWFSFYYSMNNSHTLQTGRTGVFNISASTMYGASFERFLVYDSDTTYLRTTGTPTNSSYLQREITLTNTTHNKKSVIRNVIRTRITYVNTTPSSTWNDELYQFGKVYNETRGEIAKVCAFDTANRYLYIDLNATSWAAGDTIRFERATTTIDTSGVTLNSWGFILYGKTNKAGVTWANTDSLQAKVTEVWYDTDTNETLVYPYDILYNETKDVYAKVLSIDTAADKFILDGDLSAWSDNDVLKIDNKGFNALIHTGSNPINLVTISATESGAATMVAGAPFTDFKSNALNGNLIIKSGINNVISQEITRTIVHEYMQSIWCPNVIFKQLDFYEYINYGSGGLFLHSPEKQHLKIPISSLPNCEVYFQQNVQGAPIFSNADWYRLGEQVHKNAWYEIESIKIYNNAIDFVFTKRQINVGNTEVGYPFIVLPDGYLCNVHVSYAINKAANHMTGRLYGQAINNAGSLSIAVNDVNDVDVGGFYSTLLNTIDVDNFASSNVGNIKMRMKRNSGSGNYNYFFKIYARIWKYN